MSVPDIVTFTEDDCEVFSRASGDRNPLHLDAQYARVTPFGQRVVFGCLGAIASLARIKIPVSWVVTSLEAEFVRPMFLGLSYRLELSEKEGEWTGRLFDGTLMLASLRIKAAPVERPFALPAKSCFGLIKAISRNQVDVTQGTQANAEYAPDPAAMAELVARWGSFDSMLGAVLCCCSYVVGMDLPGKTALFSKISLQFGDTVQQSGNLSYTASVASLNAKIGQIRVDFNIARGEGTIASGKLWSFIRPELTETKENAPALPKTRTLAGRTAVIIGASRGLGAAVQEAFESRGATVYALSRSKPPGATTKSEAGDAADVEVVRRFRKRVMEEQGRVDFLICNACPSIPPFRMEANTLERMRQYVDQALMLTLAPLCEFLEDLNASGGCAVIISSSAVEQPVREWPHYIAAKQAVEGMARVAVLQYPQVSSLIVRPHKMLTAMTDTPTGRIGAEPPELCAARIATRLEGAFEPGKVEMMTW